MLGAVTLAALAAPVPLLKRGLRSTAESVAGLGLALTVLDAYALYEVALPEVDGLGYAAVASAVLAVLWAAYGLTLGALTVAGGRSAAPAAAAGDGDGPAPAAALGWRGRRGRPHHHGRAAADGGVRHGRRPPVVRAVRTCRRHRRRVRHGRLGHLWRPAGCPWTATGPSAAARAAALLLFAAAIALAAAWHAPRPRAGTGLALTGGLITVAATGGVLRSSLPDAWTVPGYLVCGVALLAVLRTRLPEPVRHGLGQASACVQAVAVLWALSAVTVVLLGPVELGPNGRGPGSPANARDAVTTELPWPPHAATAPLVLALVAAVLAVAARGTAPGARGPWPAR